MCSSELIKFVFFFNDTATTEIYTLSLHDALPISPRWYRRTRRGTSTLCRSASVITNTTRYSACCSTSSGSGERARLRARTSPRRSRRRRAARASTLACGLIPPFRPGREGPPLPAGPSRLFVSLASSSEWAVAGARLADQSRRAGRNELYHDVHQVDTAFVPDDVHIPGWFEETRPGRNHVRRAGRVVTLVEGRGAGLDDHKARPQVAVPAQSPAGLNRDLYDMDVGQALRLDLCLPVAAHGVGLDLVELRHRGERRDRHSRRGCRERARDIGDKKPSDHDKRNGRHEWRTSSPAAASDCEPFHLAPPDRVIERSLSA